MVLEWAGGQVRTAWRGEAWPGVAREPEQDKAQSRAAGGPRPCRRTREDGDGTSERRSAGLEEAEFELPAWSEACSGRGTRRRAEVMAREQVGDALGNRGDLDRAHRTAAPNAGHKVFGEHMPEEPSPWLTRRRS